jgi:hypothetical protein
VSAFTRLFRLRFRKGVVAGAPRRFVPVGAVNFLMCTGRRREVNRLSMGGRRVTADRRYENGESGDYSQDIFNLHSLSSFLVQPGISPT